MKKEYKVSCSNCGKEHLIDENQICIVPVGYKGKVKCYIICDHCKNEILLPLKWANKKKLNKIIIE